jgi:hypothetical protein
MLVAALVRCSFPNKGRENVAPKMRGNMLTRQIQCVLFLDLDIHDGQADVLE